MGQKTFFIGIFTMLALVVQSYSMFRAHFYTTDHLDQQIVTLKGKIERETLARELVEFQHKQFRSEVARLLPGEIKKHPKVEKSYPLRNLASVIGNHEAENFQMSEADIEFARIKGMYKSNNLIATRKQLRKFIDKYPFSVNIAEAHFLLVESEFQLESYKGCVMAANDLLSLFPEHELTGFALLRIGKIFEIQRRPEDAVEIYRTVLRSFPQRDVASAAGRSLRSLDL